MNLSEFKAWFEGFTENLDGRPSDKAWKKICDKVKQIKDAPATTYPVFVERYWPRSYTFYACSDYNSLSGGVGLAASNAQQPAQSMMATYDAGSAFRALGKHEASEIVN